MFNLDLTDGFVLLRLTVGLFLLPHAYGKARHREGVDGFFTAAGFRPTAPFITFGLIFEVVAGLLLVLGVTPLITQVTAALTVIFMAVAAVANHRVCQGKWLWNMGGSEYPVFWGICAAIVALNPT